MAKRKRRKKTQDELNAENEFLKLKMMAEFGGHFSGSDQLPAEVENLFLRQIINFHKQHDQARKITVYEYIGEPPYNHVHDMSEREIKRDLKKLMRLMQRKGVTLEVLAPTADREVYRFITEELFKEELEDVKLKGWSNHFVYEEFHPNVEFDIKNSVHFILLALFDAEGLFTEDYFAEDMKDSLGLTTDPEELREKVRALHAAYYDVMLVDYDFMDIHIDKPAGKARVVCDVTFKTQKAKGKRSARHTHTVELFLRQDGLIHSIWQLTRINTDAF